MKKKFILLFVVLSYLVHSQQSSIHFNNSGTPNAWVKLGNNANLGLFNFTLECWFKRTGAGVIATTGSGGVTNAVPLITKGEGESDGSNVDCNYFFGIRQSDSVLVADFEEGAAGSSPGLNHPVIGKTPLARNVWYHGAITYNGTVWNLYLNGVREASLSVGQPCQGNSIQHSAIGSACNSTGANSGYFAGAIDEARIWNTALTQAQIMNNMRSEITAPTTSLVARWGINEGLGANIANTGTAVVTGTLTGVNYQWSTQSPFTNLTPGSAQSAIALNAAGTPTSWVKFGDNANLKLFNFTLECWVKRLSNGTTSSSGSGGITALPLITKGRGEAENSNVDCNYLFGINQADTLLSADFEEGALGSSPGLNHPVKGKTPIQRGVWYHTAVTYDGTVWKLYVNGVLDNTLTVSQPCQGNSIQHFAIGTACNSTGATEGFFSGIIDEARVWNTALTQNQIVVNMNSILPNQTPNMVARFGFDESTGTTVSNSSTAAITGTIQAANYSWTSLQPQFINPVPTVTVPGVTLNQAPVVNASLSVPANSATCLNATSTKLSVKANDSNNDSLWVKFYGRKKNNGKDFSIVPVPDTQFYTSLYNGGTNAMYKAQMNWVSSKKDSANIQYIMGLGDCVNDGDSDEDDWRRVDTCMKIIETNTASGMPNGIPYILTVGNHDQGPTGNGDPALSTTFFNQYFGEPRFTGRNYYGGHYGTNNDNSYQFFSASGMDFLVISLEWDPNNTYPAVITWMQNLIASYPNKKVIVVAHYILNEDGTFGAQGQRIYDAIKTYPNVFLTLSGHVSSNGGGESSRTDVYNGNTIQSVMSDYQSYVNGGAGWLRVMTIRPSQNLVDIYTINPYTSQTRTGVKSRFTLNYDFGEPYTVIDSVKVASGQTASVNWNTLQASTNYEWYASVSDGSLTSTSPVSKFTTQVYKVKLGNDNAHCGALVIAPTNTTCATCVTSYSWSSGATTSSINVSTSNQFIVNVVDSLNCSSSDTMNVTITNIPAQAGNISGNFNICAGSVNIYSIAPVAEAASYSWTTSGWNGTSTTNTISLTSTNNTATLSVVAQNSCGISPVRTLQVIPNTVPALPSSITGNSLICGIASHGYSITAVPNATAYVWNLPATWIGSSTSNTIQVTPTIGVGNISVAASNFCGVSSTQTLSVSAFVLPNTQIIIAGSNSICLNASVTLYASGANSYTWNTLSTTNTITISPSTNTTYSVNGSVNGCSNSASVMVNVLNSPTVTVSGASLVCAGDVINLTASGANTYLWNNGNTAASFSVALNNTSTYSIIGTDVNGCSNTISKTVTVNPLPLIAINGNTALCQGESVTLSANGASTYTWNTLSTSTSIVVSPNTTTVYSVTGMDVNGCNNFAIKTLVVNPIPQVSVAGTATAICKGDNVTLNALGAANYTWNTSSNMPFITVSPVANTTYSVNGQNLQGCSNTAFFTLTVNNLPNISIAANPTFICSGETSTLTVSGASTYTWSNFENGNSIVITPNTTSTYGVSGVDANTCENEALFILNVNTCTGIENIQGSAGFNVYPNPGDGEFFFEGNFEAGTQVLIINARGQQVLKSELSNTKNKIHLEAGKGIYFYQVISHSKQIASGKLVVE